MNFAETVFKFYPIEAFKPALLFNADESKGP